MEEFDYNNFFFNCNEDIKAIKIITPSMTITSYADIHEEEAIRIMKTLYCDFKVDEDSSWSSAINDRGCVAIQMLSDFEVVYIPEFVNFYQFNELFIFYQNIMKVNRLKRKYGNPEVKIYTNYYFDDKFLDLGRALILLKKEIFQKEKTLRF